MLDTQMPRNSQRDDEELCYTPEQGLIDNLNTKIEQLQAENDKQKDSIQLLSDEVKEKALELGLTEISRNGLKERLESCEIALEDRDNKIETLKALHIDDLRDLDREINEKDKSIQLLAGKLKEAADHIWDHSTGEPPKYDVTETYLKYSDLANQFIDGE